MELTSKRGKQHATWSDRVEGKRELIWKTGHTHDMTVGYLVGSSSGCGCWGHGHEARSALQLRFGFGFASSLAEHIKGKTTKHLSG